jgi:hypothetical protein
VGAVNLRVAWRALLGYAEKPPAGTLGIEVIRAKKTGGAFRYTIPASLLPHMRFSFPLCLVRGAAAAASLPVSATGVARHMRDVE